MILVEGVSKTFIKEKGNAGVVRALDNVDLTIRDGEFICLIGPSGCGKTTLLRIINGLATPDKGSVSIDGTPVTGPGLDRAMVFQGFSLLPWRTTLANVELGLEARGVARQRRREVAHEMIERVGLGGFELHFPHELSGGMQQRAGLARALAVEPRILLMDEPFGSVDEQTRRILQIDLTRVWDEQRQTVVFVTHSMDEAVYLADRVVMMSPRPGRIMEILDVPLPRPRADEEVRRSAGFAELSAYIWDRLKEYGEAHLRDAGTG